MPIQFKFIDNLFDFERMLSQMIQIISFRFMHMIVKIILYCQFQISIKLLWQKTNTNRIIPKNFSPYTFQLIHQEMQKSGFSWPITSDKGDLMSFLKRKTNII